MKKDVLVSVIIPTKNSEKFIERCIVSVKNQTYKNIEVIVVDNFSSDKTPEISRKLGVTFFQKGPERSTQRNYAVSQARGEYVFIIDSDMELSATVVQECVEAMEGKPYVAAVVVPEESFGEGFWAQCKKLERSFYVGVSWMEAARFFRHSLYQQLGGYDEKLISGEDWDLSQRAGKTGKIASIKSYIFHNEGKINLWKTIKKKYYYAQKFSKYAQKNKGSSSLNQQTGILGRYKLFFSKPGKLFANPIVGLGMLFMKTCEFLFGGLGLVLSNLSTNEG